MTDEFNRERFKIERPDADGLRHAYAAWGGFPCNYLLDIAWRASLDGRITALKVRTGSACT